MTLQKLLCTCIQGFNIPSEGVWFWFEGVIDFFYYIDLALNFFTAYEVCRRQTAAWSLNANLNKVILTQCRKINDVQHGLLHACRTWPESWLVMCVQDPISGEYITDYKAIARRYLSGWFTVDLLATLPVDYIVRAVEVSYD